MKYITFAIGILITSCVGNRKPDVITLNNVDGTTGERFLIADTPVFHLKVAGEGHYYRVLFTNDNWVTEDYIKRADDFSNGDNPVKVSIWVDLRDCEEAIAFARQFKTYDSCVNYNKRIQRRYDKLLKHRQANPHVQDPPDPPTPSTQPICAPETVIY